LADQIITFRTEGERSIFFGSNSVTRFGEIVKQMGGPAHALAEAIQAPYRLLHWAAIAVVLPHVMPFYVVANPSKYANSAEALGAVSRGFSETEVREKSIGRVKEIINRVGLLQKLLDLGIAKTEKMIVRWTGELAPSPLRANPSPGEADLVEILTRAY
jgi:alcohol dehydrogenase class IV